MTQTLEHFQIFWKCSKVCVIIKVSTYQEFWQLPLLIIDYTWKTGYKITGQELIPIEISTGGKTLNFIHAGVLFPSF